MPQELLKTTSVSWDKLIAGDQIKPISLSFKLKKGEKANRGDLMGQIKTLAQTAVAGGGNVGDGEVSDIELLAGFQKGTYTITFTSPTDFDLTDPIAGTVGSGTVGVEFSTELKFTVSAGGTPFAISDTFTILVEDVDDGPVVLSDASAIDGSEEPELIVLNTDEVDATTEEESIQCYVAGIFDTHEISYGPGHTYLSTRRDLRFKGIFLKEGYRSVDV